MSLELSTFLEARQKELVERWIAAVRREPTPEPVSRAALVNRLPAFIGELISALRTGAASFSRGTTALSHGAQRFDLGFDVGAVVREYGILHRCIVELAAEAEIAVSPRERIIVLTVINVGIADAVSQYVSDRDAELRRQMSEHLGFIAHEVRSPLSSARVAMELLQRRELAAGGRLVDLLARTLRRTQDVVDNALNHATLSLGVAPRLEALRLRDLLNDIVLDFAAEAERKEIDISLDVPGDPTLDADRRLLASALSNLVQNALKFTRPRSMIEVRARRTDGEISIEVEDACGGLPPGKAEDLFKPLVRRGRDQTGFGLGLAIAQQAAQAHGGTLSVRDLPRKGCVFQLVLPARAAAAG
jgi:signal transduction histidine kinase